MRILLTLEYDGTAYAGWQRQENALAVQQVVEEAVSRLVGERTVLFGASRTDAGVHALGQRAHFDTASRIPPDKYAYALNTMLPRDIRVRESRAGGGRSPRPLLRRGQAVPLPNLLRPPRRGAQPQHPRPRHLSLGRGEDARGTAPLCSAGTILPPLPPAAASSRTPCAGSPAPNFSRDGPEYALFIEGTGFLYNMVRIIAGTLIGVGTGKLQPGAFSRALISKSRLDLGVTAPAHGLTLMEVYYGESARL